MVNGLSDLVIDDLLNQNDLISRIAYAICRTKLFSEQKKSDD